MALSPRTKSLSTIVMAADSPGPFTFKVQIPASLFMTNAHAGDWKSHTLKYDSSKKVTTLVLVADDVLLESVEIEGPLGGKVTLKSKPAVLPTGKLSASLKFDATAETGEKATDDTGIQIGATLKKSFELWKANANFGSITNSVNVNLDVEGSATLGALGVLNTDQKATAIGQWKAGIANFPLSSVFEAKFTEKWSEISQSDNDTLEYGAFGKIGVIYRPSANSPITIDFGYGFGGNFKSDSQNLWTQEVSGGLDIKINRKISIFGRGKLENKWPMGESNGSRAGTDTTIEAGIKYTP